jgi:hypothetical protein
MQLIPLASPLCFSRCRYVPPEDTRRDATRFLAATLVQNAMAQHGDAEKAWLYCHEVEGHMHKSCQGRLKRDWDKFDAQRKKVCCFHRAL